MASGLLTKRALIDRTNSTVVIIAGVAAFISIFSLVATKMLISQSAYQNRVITAKRETLNQLEKNKTAAKQLQSSYQGFTSTAQNIIGGNPGGQGDKDGDNAKIVLDALPSKYDFPALVNSLEAILSSQNVKITSISGTDDELAQAANSSSATPQAVPMPFQLSVTGDYGAIQGLVSQFEHSIRPIQLQTMEISGGQNNLTLTIGAQSFYQPAKTFKISTKVVK